MQETLTRVSESTLQEPITITVDVNPRSWLQKKAMQWGWLPKKRVFIMRPVFLGTLIRISRILLSLDMKLPDVSKGENQNSKLLEANYQAIVDHSKDLARIVALAISNRDTEPDASLVRFILGSFTTAEMLGVLSHVLRQMDLSSFMSSIISVRGLSVLETRTAAPATPVNGTEVSL